MELHKTYSYLLLLALLLLFACSNSPKGRSALIDTATNKHSLYGQVDSVYEVIYDTFRANLNGARFKDTETIYNLVSFSDPSAKDTFAFKIQPGFVANSTTHFYIKNPSGTLLFSDSFNTDWMVFDLISEVIPHTNMTTKVREQMIIKISQMNSDYILNYIRKAANNMLTEVQIDRKTVMESTYMLEEDVVEDSILVKRFRSDPSLKAIFIPGFHWEEGGCIYTYVPEQKAIQVISCFD